jgi:outer membrane protein assembly factor BamA
VDRGYGGALTFTRQVQPRAPVSLTYRFEINQVAASDAYFCVSYGVCDSLTMGALRAHRALSPLALVALVDRSDIPLDPTKGYSARVDLEHASSLTASDYHYNRGFVDAAAYTHRGRNVYSAHLRVGLVQALAGAGTASGVLQPRTRFYAGGANSVRGFAENQLGPRILTIDPAKLAAGDTNRACGAQTDAIRNCDPNAASLPNSAFLPQALGGTSVIEGSIEWRFPTPFIYGKVTGAVFLDGGVVGQSNIKTLQNIQALTHGSGAITPGAGLRYESPVGPIRFDIGINPNRTESLGVVTEIVENGQRRIIPLLTSRRWSDTGPLLLDRLTFHFSIGQAY